MSMYRELYKNKFTRPIGPIFKGEESSKMGPRGYSDTSVRNCHYSLRNNSEECSSQVSYMFRHVLGASSWSPLSR